MKISLHAGMPKTGTTALQHQLSSSRSLLAENGIDYIKLHRDSEGVAHHALAHDILAGWDHAAPRLAKLDAHLAESGATRTLISSEAFTNCLQRRVCLGFMRFVELLGRRGSVSMVLALRRIDSFFESMYLHSTKVGETRVGISQYLEQRRRWSESFFSAVSALRNTGLLSALHTVRYERSNCFQDEVLACLGVPASLKVTMPAIAFRGEKLGWKSQALLLHLDEIGALLGVVLDRRRVLRAIGDGTLAFPSDPKTYSVLTLPERQQLHWTALEAASRVGLTEYAAFYGEDDPKDIEHLPLDVEAFTADDLDLILEWSANSANEIPSSK